MKRIALTLCVLLALAAVSDAACYKCVDANGVVTITDSPKSKFISCDYLANCSSTYSEVKERELKARDATLNQSTEIQRRKEIDIKNTQPASNPKENLDEMVKMERTRLEAAVRSKMCPDDIRTGSNSNKRERWEKNEKHRKDKADKDLKALNNDPKQYFYNKPVEDALEKEWQAEEVRENTPRKFRTTLGITPTGQVVPIIPIN